MKKSCLLLIFLLFTIIASAQFGEDTKVPITGLGEFTFGMSPEEMEDMLKIHKSSDTKISGIFDGESSLAITNLKLFGYTFNECFFTFIDNELRNINLTMFLDKKNKNSGEFEELLSVLESDYGKSSTKDGNIPTSWIWRNKDGKMIMFSKEQKKKRTEISISAAVDIFDTRNVEVYKK